MGYTARLDAVQAAVLALKPPHLDDWNESAPRRRALLLREAKGDRRPKAAACAARERSVWHLFVIGTA